MVDTILKLIVKDVKELEEFEELMDGFIYLFHLLQASKRQAEYLLRPQLRSGGMGDSKIFPL